MSVVQHGTCGNCGGPVETPVAWYGVYPPVPTCRHCGATPLNSAGPRLPMNPSPTKIVIEGF